MSHARKVVAIVEDKATVRRSLERLLRARGIDSESFADGEKFLRYLGESRPDCVIFGRPGGASGITQAVARIAADVFQIPILVLTGRRAASSRKPGRLAVIKPFPVPPAGQRSRKGSRSRTRREPTTDPGQQE